MRYILDTHTLLWLLFEPEHLSKNVLNILQNRKNKSFVSIISFWEIATKVKIGKLNIRELTLKDIKDECERLHFSILPVSFENILMYLNLPLFKNHRDPFDRMLIATAIERKYAFLSRDNRLPQYNKSGLLHIW